VGELVLRVIDQRELLSGCAPLLVQPLGECARLDACVRDLALKLLHATLALVQLALELIRTSTVRPCGDQMRTEPQPDNDSADRSADDSPDEWHVLQGAEGQNVIQSEYSTFRRIPGERHRRPPETPQGTGCPPNRCMTSPVM